MSKEQGLPESPQAARSIEVAQWTEHAPELQADDAPAFSSGAAFRNVQFRVGDVVKEVCKAPQDDADHHFNDVRIIRSSRADRSQLLIAHFSTACKDVVGKCKGGLRPMIIRIASKCTGEDIVGRESRRRCRTALSIDVQ